MRCLFDASALTPLFIPGAASDVAASTYATSDALSLDFARIEFASALTKQIRFAGFSVADAQAALVQFGILAQWIGANDFLADAIALATENQHGVYDCLYVAAARAHNVPLVTADIALARKFAGVVSAGIINLYDRIDTTP